MKRFLSYEGLPIKSGGAHSVSRESPKVNYEKTLGFLNLFADNIKAESVELTLYKSKNKEYSVLNLLTELTIKFGIPKTKNDGWLKSWTWSLKDENIQKGFEMLELNKDLPKNPVGPITLNFCWNFLFKDPKTNQVLPNQELIPVLDFRVKNSRIYLRLSQESTISVWFAFPFARIDKYESAFIGELKSKLPFKASDKHWRMWEKSSNGNWIPRKIEI
ncbi:hypothetical protein [Croceimicrobium hydrocarbonivorans]|uniref:Uncharacterized protein n=1 Tax=Croceimicrobium hydrocarbonivorans TaxID=2761580 RepID=A0A7H0VFP3_9FLAO|nr:hypothetical protein [Croceimicrobium hydrocarbonivorans]QNR24541.1 hypothetical protein H4K34_01490 [Croceimicrobium hydrocarbonivorans]